MSTPAPDKASLPDPSYHWTLMAQVFLGALAELGRVGEAAPRVERGHGQCEHWDHSRKRGASFPEPAVFTLDRINPVNFVPAVGPLGAARPPRPHVDGRSDRPRELAPLFIHSGLGLLELMNFGGFQ